MHEFWRLLDTEPTRFLDGIESKVQSSLMALAQRETSTPGACLSREGTPTNRISMLEKGYAKVTRDTPSGEQVLLHVLGPGDLFPNPFQGNGMHAEWSVYAITPCHALHWPRSVIVEAAGRSSSLALHLLTLQGDFVSDLMGRYSMLAGKLASPRLASALLSLVRRFGHPMRDGVLLDVPLTLRDLAQMTGMTHFTVSRRLCEWKARGLILVQKRRILIRDIDQFGIATLAE